MREETAVFGNPHKISAGLGPDLGADGLGRSFETWLCVFSVGAGH